MMELRQARMASIALTLYSCRARLSHDPNVLQHAAREAILSKQKIIKHLTLHYTRLLLFNKLAFNFLVASMQLCLAECIADDFQDS